MNVLVDDCRFCCCAADKACLRTVETSRSLPVCVHGSSRLDGRRSASTGALAPQTSPTAAHVCGPAVEARVSPRAVGRPDAPGTSRKHGGPGRSLHGWKLGALAAFCWFGSFLAALRDMAGGRECRVGSDSSRLSGIGGHGGHGGRRGATGAWTRERSETLRDLHQLHQRGCYPTTQRRPCEPVPSPAVACVSCSPVRRSRRPRRRPCGHWPSACARPRQRPPRRRRSSTGSP